MSDPTDSYSALHEEEMAQQKQFDDRPMTDLFERLAAIEHGRWADWQKWMHEQCSELSCGELVIPKYLVDRWTRQIETPYADLSDTEKESDRSQVRRYWHLVQPERDSE